MKVLSYVIELFHVHQTVMLAWSATQDVSAILRTFMFLTKAWWTQPGSCCYCHFCSSLLTWNLVKAELQALTWSRCSERLGLWGITNRVWHLLLLTGLLRSIGPCCFAVVERILTGSSGKVQENYEHKVQHMIKCGVQWFFLNLVQSVNDCNLSSSLAVYDKHMSAGVLLCLAVTGAERL